MPPDLLAKTPSGLYCAAGDFYIDPSRPVERAVITHGHADHARKGHGHYLTVKSNLPILKRRLGQQISTQSLDYEERLKIGDVALSFHPAGHVLGSSQVRLEKRGLVWVVSGDYKTEDDGLSGAFAPIQCHTFITESTFALPIYRWDAQSEIFKKIKDWWKANQEAGRPSVLFTYSLGKAQRILYHLEKDLGPILVHRAVANMNEAYRENGIPLGETLVIDRSHEEAVINRALIIAPRALQNSAWYARLTHPSNAFASGWMRVRGSRHRNNYDRGFVLSDHADWPGLLKAIEGTKAEKIIVTHGYTAQLIHYLNELGLSAHALETAMSHAPLKKSR